MRSENNKNCAQGETERVCENCRFFIAEYVKHDTCLVQIGGHCGNWELNIIRRRNQFKLEENCGFWQIKEDKKVKRKENIFTVLKNMESHLSDIAIILKDDNN